MKREQMIIIMVIILFVGVLIISNFFIKFDSNKESSYGIKEILNNPSSLKDKQLQIKGFVYASENKLYVRDSEGYKIELRECQKNRDIKLNTSQIFEGFIFINENPTIPVFFCGVYNGPDYLMYKKSMDDEILALDTQKKEYAQASVIEEGRKKIEDEYQIKLAKIYQDMPSSEVINIIGFEPDVCDSKPMDIGKTYCQYNKIIDDRYKVSFYIVHRKGVVLGQQSFSVITI